MYVKNEIDRSRTRAYIGVRGHVRRVLVAALLNSYYNSNIKFYDNEFDEASYLLPFFRRNATCDASLNYAFTFRRNERGK